MNTNADTDSLRLSSRTLESQLSRWFVVLMIVFSVLVSILVLTTVHLTEDHLAEQQLTIDATLAVNQIRAGKTGILSINPVTIAYTSEDLIPQPYRSLLENKASYLGEIGSVLDPQTHRVWKQRVNVGDEWYDLVLLSEADSKEFSHDDFVVLAFGIMAILLLTVVFLWRIYVSITSSLTKPLHDLTKQLHQQEDDFDKRGSSAKITLSTQAVAEFTVLTERLNQYQIRLQKEAKREETFARYASHELRTPLTIMFGANRLLQRTELDKFQNKQIARIERSAQQMKQIVETLLALVKMERESENGLRESASNTPVRRSTYCISRIEIQTILDWLGCDSANSPVEIDIVQPFQSSVNVEGMQMILRNLLENALKASDGATVYVSVSKSMIEVVDQGSDTLLTGEDKSVKTQDGFGLGLQIVESICSKYGLQFELELAKPPRRGGLARIISTKDGEAYISHLEKKSTMCFSASSPSGQ